MKKVDAGKEINEAADSRSLIELTKNFLKLLAFSRNFHGETNIVVRFVQETRG